MAEEFENLEEASTPELGVSPEERARRKAIMDKRSGQELRDRWAQGDRDQINRSMDSIAPPQIIEKRCRVCVHPHRMFIEQMVIKGYAYTHIAEHVPPDDEGRKLDRRSISNHTEKHIKLEEKRIRAELDEEAAALQQNVEQGARGAITDRGMLKVLIRKAFEEAQSGTITMEIRDMIQAIKLLNDIEIKAADSRAEENEIALRIFVRAVQNVCDGDQLAAVASEVKRLRAFDEIESEMEGVLVRPGLPEAEVVDDS